MRTDGDWFEWEATLELLPWGRNTYTILTLEPSLVAAAQKVGTRRLEGTLNDEEINVGLNRADVIPDAFAYVGAGLQRTLGTRAGDAVHCRLRPADPAAVLIPDDVEQALAESGCTDSFAAKPAAEQRRLLQPIGAARSAATRQQRIEALLMSLGTER